MPEIGQTISRHWIIDKVGYGGAASLCNHGSIIIGVEI